MDDSGLSTSDVSGRKYDVVFSVAQEASEEVVGTADVALKVAITRLLDGGLLRRRWPTYTFEHPNMPAEAITQLQELVQDTVDDIVDAGIPLCKDPVAAAVVAEFRELSHDQMMVVQQHGINMTDAFGDLGLDRAEAKGLDVRAAAAIRDIRDQGDCKKKRKDKKDKKHKK